MKDRIPNLLNILEYASTFSPLDINNCSYMKFIAIYVFINQPSMNNFDYLYISIFPFPK